MRRPISIFYILVVYVFLQFCWWAYLLVDLNGEVYLQKMELAQLKNSTSIAAKTEQRDLIHKLHSKWFMVIGEGVVFLCLLTLGVYKTRRAFEKEAALNKQQHNFLLSVTHEFKSPLASIKLYLQTLQKHQLEREKQQTFIQNAITDTERLDNLVENALLATKIENHSYVFQPVLTNLLEFVQDLITINPHKSNINVEGEPQVYILADHLAFTSLVLNLVENAFKYSPDGYSVNIHIGSKKGKALLSIADQGMGIPESERKTVFEKFYRIGSEDTRKTKGTGLGLYIVKQIATGHQARISITNNLPQGTIFEISLPLVHG